MNRKQHNKIGIWILTIAVSVTMMFGPGTMAVAADTGSGQESGASQVEKTEKAATTKAGTESVTTFDELKTAVENANAGTTAEIIVENDIAMTAELKLDTSAAKVTIKGKTGSETLKRGSAFASGSFFDVTKKANVTFEKLTLDGNRANSSIVEAYNEGTVLNFNSGCTVRGAGASKTSGAVCAVYLESGMHCYVNSGALITDNFSTYGAVYVRDAATRLYVKGSFTNNTNTGQSHNGGAISLYDGTTILYDGCLFSGNKAMYGPNGGAGGAINISNVGSSSPGKLIMFGGTIKDNEADAETTVTKMYAKDAGGGGVAVCRGIFVMYGGTITGNKASYGGGVSVNNEGSTGDRGGYFIGLGGTVSGNTAWATSTLLGDKKDVPIVNNSPDISTQSWGKAIVSSAVKQTSGYNRVGLPFKADINVDVTEKPAGTNVEIRNAHEKYVARGKTNEGDALNTAYSTLSQSGKALEGYYQIGFHSTDKNNYRVGRETRWFMGAVDTGSFEGLSSPTDTNVDSIINNMNELTGTGVDEHNTANCAPWSNNTGDVTVRINYPDYTNAGTHDFKILYIPYDKSDGTAGTPQVLTPTEKSDGLYVTVKGGCRGAFEVEKKARPATIKFEANGGSGTMTDQTVNNVIDYDNTKVDPNTVPGTKIKTNTLTPPSSDYVFAGWSTTPYSQGSSKDYNDGDMIRPNAGENITLYAVWEAKATPMGDPATVTFHSNFSGSAVTSYTQSIPAGVSTALRGNLFSRSGYTITGWNTKADGTGTKYSLGQAVKLGNKQQLDLYAVWQADLSPAYILLPKAIAKGKTKQVVTWTKVGDADGYYIYFGHCAHKYKKVKTIKGNKTFKWTKGKLKKGKKYKYYVAAYKVINGKKKIIKRSITVHSIAGNKVKKLTNTKSIKASRKTATVAVGKTVKIKAKVKGVNKGKIIMSKDHAAKVRYISGDKRVATVSKKGVIKGKRFGTVKIYVLAVNGVRTYVKVTVK